MSESKFLEYALRWPDTGEVYKTYSTASEANVSRNDILLAFNRLGVPPRFAPTVGARVTKTVTSDWMDLADAETLFQTENDAHPHPILNAPSHQSRKLVVIAQDVLSKGAVVVPPEQVDDEQVARVRSGRFGFGEPCVICGITFRDCVHSTAETVALIKRVDPSKRIRR